MSNNRRFLIYALMFCLLAIAYLDRSVLSVSAEPIAQQFHLSVSDLGIVFSVFSWTYLVFLLPGGILVDKIGPKATLIISIALWSIATIFTGVAGSVGFLVMTRLVMGVGEASSFPALARVSIVWAPERERALVASIYNAGSSLGPALGSLLTVWLLSRFSWPIAFFVAGALGIAWLIVWALAYHRPEDTQWLPGPEKAKILGERRANVDAPSMRPRLADLGRLLGHSPALWLLMIVQGSAVYVTYMFLTFLPTYLETAHHLTVTSGGLESALPYFGAVVGGIVIGIISDRIVKPGTMATGRRRFVVATCLIVSAIGLIISPFTDSVPLVIGLITISLTFAAASISNVIALGMDVLRDPQLIGQSQAIIPIGGNAFGLLAPIVTGFTVQATGSYLAAFVAGTGLLVVGAVLVLFVGARSSIGTKTWRREDRIPVT